MAFPVLHDAEFRTFQKIIFQEAGIDLNEGKKLLVQSRLARQLIQYGFDNYVDYLRLVQINPAERTEMVNLITTNETYFFREIEHFEFIQHELLPSYPRKNKFRVWSAASSVGAEAYSTAMILDKNLPKLNWEIVGTDINTDVIKIAKIGLYPESWVDKIPMDMRKEYCLKGRGEQEGKFLIDRTLVSNLRFEQANLLDLKGNFGYFDLIFLRNVLIYFDNTTKQKVVDNVLKYLVPGGYFFISHTENLNMLNIDSLERVKTAIYRKKG